MDMCREEPTLATQAEGAFACLPGSLVDPNLRQSYRCAHLAVRQLQLQGAPLSLQVEYMQLRQFHDIKFWGHAVWMSAVDFLQLEARMDRWQSLPWVACRSAIPGSISMQPCY